MPQFMSKEWNLGDESQWIDTQILTDVSFAKYIQFCSASSVCVSGDSDLFEQLISEKQFFKYSGMACRNPAAKYPEHSPSLLVFLPPDGSPFKGSANGPFPETLWTD